VRFSRLRGGKTVFTVFLAGKKPRFRTSEGNLRCEFGRIYVKRGRRESNPQPPDRQCEDTAKQTQAGKGLATLPFCAAPCAAPSDAGKRNADGSPDTAFSPTERRQESKSEGDGGTLVDLLTLDAGADLDLDRLAGELRRRLTAGDCRRLAELLTGDETR